MDSCIALVAAAICQRVRSMRLAALGARDAGVIDLSTRLPAVSDNASGRIRRGCLAEDVRGVRNVPLSEPLRRDAQVRIANQSRNAQRWETLDPALFPFRRGGQPTCHHFVLPTQTAPRH